MIICAKFRVRRCDWWVVFRIKTDVHCLVPGFLGLIVHVSKLELRISCAVLESALKEWLCKI